MRLGLNDESRRGEVEHDGARARATAGETRCPGEKVRGEIGVHVARGGRSTVPKERAPRRNVGQLGRSTVEGRGEGAAESAPRSGHRRAPNGTRIWWDNGLNY